MLNNLQSLYQGISAQLRRFRGADATDEPERRQWLRHPGHGQTVCKPIALGENVRLPAQIRDVSAGGINLVVKHPLQQGELLHVELPRTDSEPDLLACVVQVTMPAGNSYALGCSFIRELSEEELQRFLD